MGYLLVITPMATYSPTNLKMNKTLFGPTTTSYLAMIPLAVNQLPNTILGPKTGGLSCVIPPAVVTSPDPFWGRRHRLSIQALVAGSTPVRESHPCSSMVEQCKTTRCHTLAPSFSNPFRADDVGYRLLSRRSQVQLLGEESNPHSSNGRAA